MEQSIGDRIKLIRETNGPNGNKLSQKAFAERLGVSRGVVSNMEYNLVKPDIPMVKAICSEFNIDFDWMMTGNGEMYPDFSNPVADRINDLLEGENETAKAVFRAFAEFSDDDWKFVQKFIDKLKKEGNE